MSMAECDVLPTGAFEFAGMDSIRCGKTFIAAAVAAATAAPAERLLPAGPPSSLPLLRFIVGVAPSRATLPGFLAVGAEPRTGTLLELETSLVAGSVKVSVRQERSVSGQTARTVGIVAGVLVGFFACLHPAIMEQFEFC